MNITRIGEALNEFIMACRVPRAGASTHVCDSSPPQSDGSTKDTALAPCRNVITQEEGVSRVRAREGSREDIYALSAHS